MMGTKGQGTSRGAVRVVEILMILACCIAHFTLEALPAPSMTKTGVVKYLSQFGYLPPMDEERAESMSHEEMSSAISEFQSFAGMEATGEMNAETTHMMTMSRCGDKDVRQGRSGRRLKRWGSYGNTWRKNNVTYKISKYTDQLEDRAVDEETQRAFDVWSDYVDLSFSPNTENADIDIKFARGTHGRGDTFDGPGMVLAHALAPGRGTWMHFDDDEKWSTRSSRGVDYFTVAVHEVGHSLGLDHSRVKGSIMWPYISNARFVKLHADDIEGIQTRYGPKTKRVPEKIRNEVPIDVPGLCENPQIDATFISLSGDIYFFRGEHYWKLMTSGLASEYPQLISKTWKGLPGNLDYALTKDNGRTYFFKGSKYWSFLGVRMDRGYPREVSDGSKDTIVASKRASSLGAMIYCTFRNKSG